MSDQMKAVAIQSGNQAVIQQQAQADPNIEMITNSIFVDDTSLKRILKGEVHSLLNEERTTHESLKALLLECWKNKSIDSVQLNELMYYLQQSEGMWGKVSFQLRRYYRMVPYLIMLSPLTRLSNLLHKEMESMCRRIDIMIGRDKLMSSGEDDNFEDANFYDALGMACKLAVHDSENGWKFKGLSQNVSTLHHTFSDGIPGQAKKKRFGLF
jgi:hypothetical protein